MGAVVAQRLTGMNVAMVRLVVGEHDEHVRLHVVSLAVLHGRGAVGAAKREVVHGRAHLGQCRRGSHVEGDQVGGEAQRVAVRLRSQRDHGHCTGRLARCDGAAAHAAPRHAAAHVNGQHEAFPGRLDAGKAF